MPTGDPCPVTGCHRTVWAKGLCLYHYKRQRAGKPLTPDGPQVGDPSGHGRYGVVDRDEHQVLCHECGTWFASVAAHIYQAHGLTARAYRRRHGIPSKTPLVSLALGRELSERASARVGSAAWRRLEEARDPEAAMRARTPESWASKRRPEAGEQARVNGRANTPTVYACAQCGSPLTGRRITCSPECESAHRDHALRTYQAGLPGRITAAERDELLAALPTPGDVIRQLQARGAYSSDIAAALGVSPAWMAEHYPRRPWG